MKVLKETGVIALTAADGSFNRPQSGFRNFISSKPGSKYPPEPNRYHLYVSLACPWASRTVGVRYLRGLESQIGLSIVNPIFKRTNPDSAEDLHNGWTFEPDEQFPEITTDPVFGARTIREIYEKCGDTHHKYTVPVLFDKKTKTIVNNESSEIIRMLTEFKPARNADLDLYPEDLREKIDEINEWIYNSINNGVYKAGFAIQQAPYDKAAQAYFDALDRVESILTKQRYLVSNDRFTEADLRLFHTLLRHDSVYMTHFKLNQARISDYPAITGFTREIYQMFPKELMEATAKHSLNHYYRSHATINKFGIVPIARQPDFSLPHGRAKM
jgi:putative glutathione S-transferase